MLVLPVVLPPVVAELPPVVDELVLEAACVFFFLQANKTNRRSKLVVKTIFRADLFIVPLFGSKIQKTGKFHKTASVHSNVITVLFP